MKHGLFAELKRRHVYRVAVAYAVVGWVVIQAAATVSPYLHLPDTLTTMVIVVVALGFPIALVLTWAFEVTPEGVRRTEPGNSPEARAPEQHRKIGQTLNAIIIGVLVVAVALLAWRLWMPRKVSPKSSTAAVTASPKPSLASSAPAPASSSIPAKSIAVLPFENLSTDKANQYFADGMQDLILTKLADIGELKVIARTSTAKYASHPQDLKTIGRELGVATILEGSVQKAGDQVLVNVQLIRAANRSHLWAQSYTRKLKDVFGVEGEVAGKIATALKAKLSPAETARMATDLSHDSTANDLFFKAEYQEQQAEITFSTANMKAAVQLYQQAIARAPDFALAYARLSMTQSALGWFGGGGMNVKSLYAAARRNADEALKLTPNLATAHLALGDSDMYGRGDYPGALKAFESALALKPNDADALAAKGYVERRQGHFEAAITSLRKASTLDPRNSWLPFHLGLTWMMIHRYPEAERAFRRALALDPHNLVARQNLSYAILLADGDIPQALAVVPGDAPALKLSRVSLLTLQRKYPAALALLDSVPDTPDNFGTGSKALQQAELYRLMGETARARPLYAQALPKVRAQLKQQQGFNLVVAWQNLADAELGLGHAAQGLAAIAKAEALVAQSHNHSEGPGRMEGNAQLYAQAHRPDLAVPLLAKALASPGIGADYSPVMLWIDPAWDPIRKDPKFQALLDQYAQYKPALTTGEAGS
jgi:TolB-like protein/lipoprotein NlpI